MATLRELLDELKRLRKSRHDILEDREKLKEAFREAMGLLEESYVGRPPNGRVFIQAITEHHERIGVFLKKHKALEEE